MSLKSRKLFVLISVFFTYQNVKAEVLRWPQICRSGELYIKNKSNSPSSVWLQKFNKNLMRETEFELAANANLILPLEQITKEERYSLLNLNQSNSFDVNYRCNGLSYIGSSLEGGSLTFKKTADNLNQIWIQNLFTESNEVQIEFQDINYQKITLKIFTLTSLESILYAVPEAAKNWAFFKIFATHRSSVFNLTATGHDKPIAITPQKSQIDTAAYYFLVGPRLGSADTFVVKISDEKIAAEARELIRNPQKEKMLFARIQKNHQGFNRNWLKTEKSFWSWSTSEVTNFADLGSTACNGLPQEVEDRMDFWVADPGQICFWNYRVKKELTPLEVATGL